MPAFVLWFTGLSGAGKSTLANAVADELSRRKLRFEKLDGDVVRDLFPNTGFSCEQRNQHIKRIGFLAGMLERNDVSVIASFISPYRESREFVRSQTKNFIEVYVCTPLDECERRDTKGLYRRARQGEITQFTGIDDPYEVPERPEIQVDTVGRSVGDCVGDVMEYLSKRCFI